MQLRSRKRELLFADWGDAGDNDDVLADRFGNDGRWHQPPSNWQVDSPDALLTSLDRQALDQFYFESLPLPRAA